MARLQAGDADLQRAEAFLQGLVEGAADGHGLADRLHRQAERLRCVAELLEREARNLDHHVVDARLERRRRLPGDVVGDLVEGVAGGELGGKLGDGKAGGLRGQSRGAGDARVHLDGQTPPRGRMDRELDVRAAGLHADGADDALGLVAHGLVLDVGQRLLRRHGDRVAGMHAHGVKVFDGTDDHEVVAMIPHHF